MRGAVRQDEHKKREPSIRSAPILNLELLFYSLPSPSAGDLVLKRTKSSVGGEAVWSECPRSVAHTAGGGEGSSNRR